MPIPSPAPSNNFSYVVYNGIVLDVVKANLVEHKPIRSQGDTDYLYTEFSLDVTAICAPQAVSYTGGGIGGSTPVQRPGALPMVTMVAIRNQLVQPHKGLLYVVLGNIIVQSPNYVNGQYNSIDEHNGPQPEAWVTQPDGGQTFLVNFKVKTWIRECPTYIANSSYESNGLISNRWSMSHTTNENFVTTVNTQGSAVFSSQVLSQSEGNVADSYRSLVLPKIPKGYQRTSVYVQQNDLGNALVYNVTDVQKPISIGDAGNTFGVVHFNAIHSTTVQPQSPNGGQSPYIMRNFQCQVKGSPLSERADLLSWGAFLAAQRLGLNANPGPNDPRVVSYSVTEKIHDKEVEVSVQTFQWPNPAGAKNGGIVAVANAYFVTDDDQKIPLFNTGDLASAPGTEGFNPQPDYDEGKRGDCRILQAQGLFDACSQEIGIPASQEHIEKSNFLDYSTIYYDDSQCKITVAVGNADSGSPGEGVLFQNNIAPATSWHTEWRLDQKLVSPEGRFVLPVAGPDGTMPMTVKTHARYHLLVVDWTAERYGVKPICPSPYVNDSNMKLLKVKGIETGAPELGADLSSYVYRVSGTYYYVLMKPIGVTGPGESTASGYGMGALPWIQNAFTDSDLQLTDSDFVHGIIDDSNGGTAGAIGGATVGIKSQV